MSFTVSKVTFILQIVCMICLNVLKRVTLITHYSDSGYSYLLQKTKLIMSKSLSLKISFSTQLKIEGLYYPLQGIQ